MQWLRIVIVIIVVVVYMYLFENMCIKIQCK